MLMELRPGREDPAQATASSPHISSPHMYVMMPVQVRVSKCVRGGHGCQKKG